MLGNLSDRSIRRFWEHVREQGPWAEHEGLQGNYDFARLIPFNAHADGAAMYTNAEFFVWSWTSGFSSGSMLKDVLVNRFPISIVSEFQMEDEQAARLSYLLCQILRTPSLPSLPRFASPSTAR